LEAPVTLPIAATAVGKRQAEVEAITYYKNLSAQLAAEETTKPTPPQQQQQQLQENGRRGSALRARKRNGDSSLRSLCALCCMGRAAALCVRHSRGTGPTGWAGGRCHETTFSFIVGEVTGCSRWVRRGSGDQ